MAAVATEAYNYRHFRLRHMLADLRFAPGGLEPGQQLPRLVLETVEGDALDLAHLDRPHLLVFGSNTCPMTASAGPTLERLQGEFGADIGFVLVQVREAHPGERLDQPTSVQEKASLARRLHDALGVNMIAAFDDLDGSLHTAVDPKPNAAYLVACDGTILFRALWSSDDRGLRSALAASRAAAPRPRLRARVCFAPWFAPSATSMRCCGRPVPGPGGTSREAPSRCS